MVIIKEDIADCIQSGKDAEVCIYEIPMEVPWKRLRCHCPRKDIFVNIKCLDHFEKNLIY